MPNLSAFEADLRGIGRSPHTVRSYLASVWGFAHLIDGKEPSIELVRSWVGTLNHGRLAPQTIRAKVAGVVAWLGFEAQRGNTAAERTWTLLRMHQVAPAVRQRDRSVVAPVTEEEYREAVGGADPMGRALMSLLWWSGARISEVVGDPAVGIPALTAEDGKALIERGYVETLGKGGRRRVLIMPTKGREELHHYVEERLRGGRVATVGVDRPPPAAAATPLLLFPFGTRDASRVLKRAMNSLAAHRFRHGYRARLRKAGVAEEMARALMGHSPASVTEGYGRVSLEEMKEAAERL